MHNLRMNCFWTYLIFRSEANRKANSAHRKPIYLPVMKLFYAASSVDDWGVCRGLQRLLGNFLTPGRKCRRTASPLAIRYRALREVEFELVDSAFDPGGC